METFWIVWLVVTIFFTGMYIGMCFQILYSVHKGFYVAKAYPTFPKWIKKQCKVED